MMYVGKNLKRKEHPEHHSEERKKRWEKLNECFLIKKGADESIAFNKIKWKEIREVYEPLATYTQSIKPIDEQKITMLQEFYKEAFKCMDFDTTFESELRVNILISSIFIKVCSIYDDVKLYTEHKLKGTRVKANGKFEYVIKRNRKAIIIIESKPSDIDQGRAQNLVGCEVAAEIDNLDVVYGIVTTFYQWNFYKCLNSCIQKDEIFLLRKGEFIDHALEEITGKINAILSD